MVAPPPHLRYNNIKFIPKRGGEPLAKAANKRRKTKTNHLYDTAALGGGLLCPAGGGLVLLGTQPAGRRHGVRTTGLANLLAQEGGVMSTNWYYSTELRVLNTQLVMAPLFRLFTSWHTVRVVGSVVLILLYLAAWFWFGRSAKLKYSGLLGAGLLVLPYGRAVPPVCAGRPLLYSAHCHQLCGAGVRGAHSARRAAAGPGGGHGAVQLCCSAGAGRGSCSS